MNTKPHDQKERLAKVMARAGVASRRDAEKIILAGRVKVDGQLIQTPATLVDASQVIMIDGKVITAIEPTQIWLYHKPVGVVVSHKDEKNRKTVFDLLKTRLPRVISIGRLDMNTEGLLLLTNNGELARHLEHPSSAYARTYRVKVKGQVDSKKLKALENGVTIDGVNYGAIKTKLEGQKKNGAWIQVTIHEGKNREVRNIMAYLDLKVERLVRVAYGPFALEYLKPDTFLKVSPRTMDYYFKDF